MINFRPADLLCLIYLKFILILILIFRPAWVHWPLHALLHVLMLTGLIFGVTKFKIKVFAARKIYSLLWTFYPVAIIIFSWMELRTLGGMIPYRFDLTSFILKAEDYLFGLRCLESFRSLFPAWIKEILSFFYLSYYFYLPIAIFPLFLKKRLAATHAIIFLATLTYLSHFIFFYFFPSLSPNYLEATWPKGKENRSALFLKRLIDFLQMKGGVRGAAFPSSHLSAAVVLTLLAWRYKNPLAMVLLIFLPLMAIAAINLGYHHALDCLAGFIIGGLLFLMGIKLKLLKEDEDKQDKE